MDAPPVQTYSVAVLAGGRGSRLGGVDKGLLPAAGQLAVERVLARIPDGVPRVIIANRNLALYRRLGLPLRSDPGAPYRGPLAGMLAALQATATPWVQILPCDGLVLPSELTETLIRAAEETDVSAAFPLDNGRGQYTCCVLHRNLAESLAQALEEGERRLGRWLDSVGAVAVEAGTFDPSPIWSVNTPEEWRRACESLAGNT